MAKRITTHNISFGGKAPLALIAGPCVIESRKGCVSIARKLAKLAKDEQIPLVFKASYDKANRTSIDGFRGPGLKKGLEILAEIKEETGLPILTDVHSVEEVEPAAQVADILQLPAFLCRQTDLVVALGQSGVVVNIKKGQFMAPEDIVHVVRKVASTGNGRILLTERGVSFGYNNLVTDMRSLVLMQEATGLPVIFDATHSVQRPGAGAGCSSGDGRLAPALARAAVATGACDALFIETHPKPSEALSDAANTLPLRALRHLWRELTAVASALGRPGPKGDRS